MHNQRDIDRLNAIQRTKDALFTSPTLYDKFFNPYHPSQKRNALFKAMDVASVPRTLRTASFVELCKLEIEG